MSQNSENNIQKIGKVYNNLDIHFQIESTQYQTLMISFERFVEPMPKHHHSSHSYEIHYISSGQGTVIIQDTSYLLTPGSLYVTGPYIDHEQLPDSNNPMTEYCIYLKEHSSSNKELAPLTHLIQSNPFWLGQDTQNIYPVLTGLFLELENRTLGTMDMVKSYLQQFLILLVRNYRQDSFENFPALPYASLDQNVLLIEESFLYEYATLNLDQLSSRLGLSHRQTERLLIKQYGYSFTQKRTDARMNAAIIHLLNSDRSISDISQQIGYASPEHFTHAFKRYFGKSPREYRKKSSFVRQW